MIFDDPPDYPNWITLLESEGCIRWIRFEHISSISFPKDWEWRNEKYHRTTPLVLTMVDGTSLEGIDVDGVFLFHPAESITTKERSEEALRDLLYQKIKGESS